jgi:hypothetical protein
MVEVAVSVRNPPKVPGDAPLFGGQGYLVGSFVTTFGLTVPPAATLFQRLVFLQMHDPRRSTVSRAKSWCGHSLAA